MKRFIIKRVGTMDKIYFSTTNKKSYLAFCLTIVGICLLLSKNTIILTIGLVIITILFDGFVNKDLIVEDKKKLYLITKRNNMLIGIVNLALLLIAFALCITRQYFFGITIFYFVYLEIFIMNFIISHKNTKFYGDKYNIKELLDRKNFDYFVYSIEKVEKYDKKRYRLQLVNKFDKENKISVVYPVSKYFKDYRQLINLFEQRKEH